MSNEIKAVSFRLSEEDVQRFREFAEEQGMNQAEMFQALMNNFEMAKAKGIITDRAKEIETFQATINNLVNMFINSLAVNQTSEERIRETLSLELHTKDGMILDLQSRNTTLDSLLDECKQSVARYSAQVKDLTTKVNEYKSDLAQKNSTIFDYQRQITTLNGVIEEYKGYKEEAASSKAKYDELILKFSDVSHANADLKSKLVDMERMRDFYKEQAETTKAELKEAHTEAKEMAAANKKEIAAINDNHVAELEKVKNEITERLNVNMQNEIQIKASKYELEIEKLNNQIKMLQTEINNSKKTPPANKTPSKNSKTKTTTK
ncbi:MAG: hypothetical protein UIM53_06135 [Acutalibacteraceae bacterium]|nr:hypothetical protein [Acutalibacteraceae bacterium]